ncbi:MAG: methionyl-tRNA formyltransferase [Candidatus Vogelbacteria bacterium]|nr:methionyl-tRNA formyltransferase [Candidatus Vogelbacteria bacterium]
MISPRLNDFVFFGTDEFAVTVLEELSRRNCRPAIIVTSPDTRAGRGRRLAAVPVKLWAEQNKISYLQPEKLETPFPNFLRAKSYKLFLVASYGQVIPPSIFNLPKYGTLNIHPSFLPKYRGRAPIQSAILNGDAETGVTIILIDEQIDHGPILKAQSVKLKTQNFIELRNQLARLGARLFLAYAPLWVAGKIKAVPQDHTRATYTKKIKKEDGKINFSQGDTLGDKGVALYRKFLAYQPWPGIYFFTERNRKRVRVIITAAHLAAGHFIVDRVKPEGKKDMAWADFQRGFRP